jgi:anti-sigma regulatory factor (Ser/Thr protein kinase)
MVGDRSTEGRSATARVRGAGDLAPIRRLLADTAATVGLAKERVERLAVAVSEVATNAIRHGGGQATVVITAGGDAVTVEVCDRGEGLQVPAPAPVDPRQLHGRGLWLASRLCDDMAVDSSRAGTTVRLTMWR